MLVLATDNRQIILFVIHIAVLISGIHFWCNYIRQLLFYLSVATANPTPCHAHTQPDQLKKRHEQENKNGEQHRIFRLRVVKRPPPTTNNLLHPVCVCVCVCILQIQIQIHKCCLVTKTIRIVHNKPKHSRARSHPAPPPPPHCLLHTPPLWRIYFYRGGSALSAHSAQPTPQRTTSSHLNLTSHKSALPPPPSLSLALTLSTLTISLALC